MLNGSTLFAGHAALFPFTRTPTVAVTSADLVPSQGTALADAATLLQPNTDLCSEYTMPTLTANRVVTLGVTGPPVTGQMVRIVRKDATANTLTVANGGTNGGNLFVVPTAPSATKWPSATFYFNSVDWVFVGMEYNVTETHAVTVT